VQGLVASLISLKPSDYNKSTALDIVAGGRLYNVVVQDERVGKDLLEKGRLKKRVKEVPPQVNEYVFLPNLLLRNYLT